MNIPTNFKRYTACGSASGAHRALATLRFAPFRAQRRGFTILMAMLVSSLVLALGLSIFSIAQKSVALSAIGRDSQFAFYAADTGAECALFWDMRHGAFSAEEEPFADAACDGQSIGPFSFEGYGVNQIFEFEPAGFCARVVVEKSDTHPRTVIHSDGYSTSCDTIETSRRALQRSVRMQY
ncbi:hypothetical protein COU20_01540 [Candidatus Kaiserbacteria bacterium CG10_big_fil_rev_8_21_14_0_10_59_10]|uniref:Type 4 fimbrial biogenesis protein PilX N-terminal domain-containing protein n=1 Tax=Candidatus Kaiserbacteria bacterium CG10_big_fil_rev_8_21_14_0_10_59_10 TaxID=1974612 RepID=A0A2H0U885_9BACT|nr:MAG: hypothetical protein COU20_01540 [Candidatus Kaiserbacteria bacterium CG10_big_fil_rev_8_21_14_0_10_59_10]